MCGVLSCVVCCVLCVRVCRKTQDKVIKCGKRQKCRKHLGTDQKHGLLFGTIWSTMDHNTTENDVFPDALFCYTSLGIYRRFRPRVLFQTAKNASCS